MTRYPRALLHAPTFLLEQIEPAPVNDGGFLDLSGKCPVDSYTGLPLPIAPVVDVDAAPDFMVNEHHHFYPRLSPVLRDTLGGRALRVSRIQRVGILQHNFGDIPFHTFFPEGPDVPSDPNEQLGMCVLACAGYLPERVVDTSRGEPIVRFVKSWELGRLRRPNSLEQPLPHQVKRFRDTRMPGQALIEAKQELVKSRRKQSELMYRNLLYGYDPMKEFMSEQVLSQDFSDIRRTVTRRFMERADTTKGLAILSIGAVLAAETATVQGRPLNEVYAELRNAGMLHHLMPPHAAALIKNKLGAKHHKVNLLPELKACLVRQHEVQVA